MKKKYLYGLLLICLIFGGLVGYILFSPTRTKVLSKKPISYGSVLPTAVPNQPVVIYHPQKLLISRLGINSLIEEVGLDRQNRMDIPKGSMNTAWYKLGYKIGDKGNAVIAGHYDKKSGSPEVFYDLVTIQIGDSIIVSGDGIELTFKVIEKKVYDDKDFPIETVFGSFHTSRLNLITCSGIYDTKSQNYSKRLVVFSELVLP